MEQRPTVFPYGKAPVSASHGDGAGDSAGVGERGMPKRDRWRNWGSPPGSHATSVSSGSEVVIPSYPCPDISGRHRGMKMRTPVAVRLKARVAGRTSEVRHALVLRARFRD